MMDSSEFFDDSASPELPENRTDPEQPAAAAQRNDWSAEAQVPNFAEDLPQEPDAVANTSENAEVTAKSVTVTAKNLSGSTVVGEVDKLTVNHLGPRLISSKIDVEADLRQSFVAPNGYEVVARRVMDKQRVVMFHAQEGGRNLAARNLLACSGCTARRIDQRSDPQIENWQLAEHPSSAWLLDLTEIEVDEWDRLLEHLAGLRDDLAEQRSVLVVVMDPDQVSGSLATKFGITGIAQPDPYAVLRSLLAAQLGSEQDQAGIKSVPDWIKFAGEKNLLTGKPPAEVARLCEAINYAVGHWTGLAETDLELLKDRLKASNRGRAVGGDQAYVELLALDHFRAWETELDAWNKSNQDKPRLKAFQLAIAVLPSGDPIQIRNAANALLSSITRSDVAQRGLEGPGTRLLALNSLATLEGGRVTFTKHGFSEAVVRYFWDDWPEYRPQFLDWLMELATGDEVEAQDQAKLKEQIGKFAIHHAQQRSEFDFLTKVISRWAGKEDTLPDAARLLEDAATTSGISKTVRQRMLQWAKQEDRSFKRAVASVCASPTFALSHPRLVIARLSHLMESQARQEDPWLQRTLQSACQLLVTEANQTHTVLSWLNDGVASERPEPRLRAVRMFLPIAGTTSDTDTTPVLLDQALQHDSTRDAIVPIWAEVLRLLEQDEIQAMFNVWMEACTRPEVEAVVGRMFKDAVALRKGEAGKAYQTMIRLPSKWMDVTDLGYEEAKELDRRLLAAVRDGWQIAISQERE